MNLITDIFFDLYGVLIDYKHNKIKINSTTKLLPELDKFYSLWIISNASNQQIKNLKQDYKFFNYFKEIITSESAEYSKPDTRIFQYALKKAKTNPYSSLFIDDSTTNVQAAHKLGFETIHYKNINSLDVLF